MKFLFIILIISISTIASASKAKPVKRILLDTWYSSYSDISLENFQINCSNSVRNIVNRLDTLQVDPSTVVVTKHLSNFSYLVNHSSYFGYYCEAKIDNRSDVLLLSETSSKMLKHLSKREHKTACDGILRESRERKVVVYDEVVYNRTLFQGRLCYVYTVELLNN